jgi:hypothetical protein
VVRDGFAVSIAADAPAEADVVGAVMRGGAAGQSHGLSHRLPARGADDAVLQHAAAEGDQRLGRGGQSTSGPGIAHVGARYVAHSAVFDVVQLRSVCAIRFAVGTDRQAIGDVVADVVEEVFARTRFDHRAEQRVAP